MDGLLIFFIIFIPLLMLICFAGVTVNAIMLMVLNVHSETRTPQSILLKNLCMCDLVHLLGGTVLVLITAAVHHKIMCFIMIFFNSFVMALNMYLVVALSLQRYISMKKFRNTLVVDEKECKFSLWIAFGMWMLAIAFAAIEYVILRPDDENCVEGLLMGVPLYRLVWYAVLPITIVIAFDIASSRLSAPRDEAIDREIEERRMQFKLTLLCFLTYTPTIFVTYVVATFKNADFLIVIFPLESTLTTLNALFHPIVMFIVTQKLRELFKDYCCCRCCCQQPADASHQRNPVLKIAMLQRGEETTELI